MLDPDARPIAIWFSVWADVLIPVLADGRSPVLYPYTADFTSYRISGCSHCIVSKDMLAVLRLEQGLSMGTEDNTFDSRVV
jgi:hypothetical protein